MKKTSLIGLSRLRLTTDGHGVTTLVAFHGCPLRCKYCLNPQCLRETASTLELTAEQIYKVLKKDELYFLATKGGATFGGGEPLLNAEFIKDLLELGAKKDRKGNSIGLLAQRKNFLRIYFYRFIFFPKFITNFCHCR